MPTERGAIPVALGRPNTWVRRPLEWKLHWILRLAVAAEFIGHGAFGVKTKEGWVAYYGVFGIPEDLAYDFMPITGSVDILLGLLVLVLPLRAVLLYMAVWGFFTATLRPLSGESIWEVVERAYNFGVPAALLLLHGTSRTLRGWFEPIRAVRVLPRPTAANFATGLRCVIGAYLIGHGALGLLSDKPGLIAHYDSIGLTGLVDDPNSLNTIVGSFEILLGLAVLAAPFTALLLFVVGWKLATEGLYITDAAYGAGWEVIERGGAYAAPLALIVVQRIARREVAPEAAVVAPGRATSVPAKV